MVVKGLIRALTVLVGEIFEDLTDHVRIVMTRRLTATGIHHLLVIFHEDRRRSTNPKLFECGVHLENILVSYGTGVDHVLRLYYLEHMLLNGRRDVCVHHVHAGSLRVILSNRFRPVHILPVLHVKHAQLLFSLLYHIFLLPGTASLIRTSLERSLLSHGRQLLGAAPIELLILGHPRVPLEPRLYRGRGLISPGRPRLALPANYRALQGGPLPDEELERLHRLVLHQAGRGLQRVRDVPGLLAPPARLLPTARVAPSDKHGRQMQRGALHRVTENEARTAQLALEGRQREGLRLPAFPLDCWRGGVLRPVQRRCFHLLI